ncbi:chemotaxis protein CheW [Acuticoccus sp.]|uniref:chemotaxis protein CheW n=1 Tax=Acuticoccus sp. TaxID=1904378 RepID=UPI003B522ADE
MKPVGRGLDEPHGFVTARLADHWFALPIASVHEVFRLSLVTQVPQSSPGVIGVMNLRGRIATALDTRQILGLPSARGGATLAIGIERRGELFGFAVDEMGDVLTSVPGEREPAPVNLDQRWREVVAGVTRFDRHLVLIVVVDRLFDGILTTANA